MTGDARPDDPTESGQTHSDRPQSDQPEPGEVDPGDGTGPDEAPVDNPSGG